MTTTSRTLFRSLLGATALSLAATASGQALAADPIKIGVIAEAQAIAGASIPQAAQMAADEINAKGGVDGRKIEIITYDNHSSSADSVRAFQRAVNEDKVNIVISSFISEVVLALEPWASRLKTPFITPGAASNEISKSVHADYEKNKYTFHGYLTSAALALSVCDAAKELLVEQKRCHHERGRRLDQAARYRVRGMPAQDRPEGPRPYPLLA
jgi:branched-chain amino acid transport system substrate-binding protein